jgi:transcriptional regulator with GAF, ATPase, and Fis domain
LRRASARRRGRTLEVATSLGGNAIAPSALARASQEALPAPSAAAGAIPTLDAAMRAHIEAALARTRGRIEGRRGAAALLAINPHTLRARMRKLGVAWNRYRED